jgi:hypothetical protein
MLPEEDDVEGWTDVFRRLGSDEPEYWGKMQVRRSWSAPLHMFVFMRTLRMMLGRPDPFWVDAMATPDPYPGEPLPPYKALEQALQRARSAGVSDQDLADIAWGAQHEALYDVFSTLASDAQSDEVREVAGNVTWSLVADDQNGNPTSVAFGGFLEGEYDDFLGYTEPPEDSSDRSRS